MKALYKNIQTILSECMSVFTKDSWTGQLSFSKLDALGFFSMVLIIFVVTFWADFHIPERLKETLIGVLSIFVVLAFQIIWTCTDKFAARLDQTVGNRQNASVPYLFEDERNNLTRLRNYTLQFVRQLTLLLLLSLFIILCSTLMLCFPLPMVLTMLSAFILSSFYIWLLLLLMMIVSIYNFLKDDIAQRDKMIEDLDGKCNK